MLSLWSLALLSALVSATLDPVQLAISAATCSADGALITKAPKINIWAPLSRSETKEVQDWVYKQEEFNLTRIENAVLKYVSC